uniref:Cytochrome P450 n=1 Tax=Panagrolaimus superbus TaxID=310955 RepID=A0A914Y9T7_9BILA
MLGVILLSLFAILIFHQFYWRRLNLPPGPMPWPLIGNIPLMDLKNIDNQLLEFKKQYGNVYTLWIPKPTVIVGGLEQLRTTFIKNGDKVSGRPYSYIMEEIFKGTYGIVLGHDSFWKNQRKFLLQFLRDFGVGKPVMENAIQIQASDVCTYFKNLKGAPIPLTKLFCVSYFFLY